MSSNDLPEEHGTPPIVILLVVAFVGFFAYMFYSLVTTSDKIPKPPADGKSGLKEQPNLLGEEDGFQVRFETTAGPFVVEVYPEWAPRGATQFKDLVESGYYDEAGFFRVVPGFVVQFGINADPVTTESWKQPIEDDPVEETNAKGTLTYATSGPNTRTTQLFINLADNSTLDGQGFSPFAKVIEGMENVEKINAEYGQDPQQPAIERQGNAYLKEKFPNLDFIKSAKIVQ